MGPKGDDRALRSPQEGQRFSWPIMDPWARLRGAKFLPCKRVPACDLKELFSDSPGKVAWFSRNAGVSARNHERARRNPLYGVRASQENVELFLCGTRLHVYLSRTIRCSAIDALPRRVSNSGSAAIRPRRNGALQGVAIPRSGTKSSRTRMFRFAPEPMLAVTTRRLRQAGSTELGNLQTLPCDASGAARVSDGSRNCVARKSAPSGRVVARVHMQEFGTSSPRESGRRLLGDAEHRGMSD